MARAELDVVANTRKATSQVKGFAKSATRSLKTIEAGFSSLGVLAAGAVGFFAGKAVLSGISAVTEAAARQEDAINNLNQALKSSGEFSEAASKDIQAFASGLQSVTKFGDEAILEQVALAKAFGATNAQAKQVTEAAIELAAATGKSLEEATRQVSKTLGGFAGELGEVNPAIKALTKEQLQAGEAAKILLEQYGGSATAQIATFSGATAQLSNSFGDLLEKIGSLVTENPSVIAAVKTIQNVVESLTGTLGSSSGGFSDFISAGVEGVVKAIPGAIRAVGSLLKALKSIAIVLRPIASVGGFVFDKLSTLAASTAQNLITAFAGIRTAFAGVANIAIKALNAVGIVSDETATSFSDSFSESFEDLKDNVNASQEGFKELFSLADDEGSTAFDSTINGINAVVDGTELAAKAAEEGVKNFANLKREAEGAAKSIEKASNAVAPSSQQSDAASFGPPKELAQPISKGEKQLAESLDENSATFADVGNVIFRTGQLFQDALGGGPINRIAEAVSSIGSLPAQFLQAFKNFDVIIEDLLKELPAVVGEIVNSLPELVNKIVAAFPKLIDQLVKALPIIAQTLANEAPKLITAILKGVAKLIDALPEIVQALVDGIGPALEAFLKGLPRVITSIFNALPQIIKTIVDAIPGILEVIADNIGPIVTALVEGIAEAIPTIVESLVQSLITEGGLVRIAVALMESIVNIFVAQGSFIAAAIFGGISQIGNFIGNAIASVFREGALDIGKTIVEGFNVNLRLPTIPTPQWVNDLIDFFKNFSGDALGLPGAGGGGGGGGFFGSTAGKVVTGGVSGLFAEGGIVPQGFPNDRFTAGLTSGEEVVTGGDRSEILQGQAQTNALLQQLASSMGGTQVVSSQVQVDGNAFADIVLELSRNNARLA